MRTFPFVAALTTFISATTFASVLVFDSAEKEKEYILHFANPYRAAERGFIDEVIKPEDTREKLIKAFSMLKNKVAKLPKKKHGNIPL